MGWVHLDMISTNNFGGKFESILLDSSTLVGKYIPIQYYTYVSWEQENNSMASNFSILPISLFEMFFKLDYSVLKSKSLFQT